MTGAISNLGAQVNLVIRQGADFAITLTFTNANGNAVDLTGCALAAQLRQSPRSDEPPVPFVFTINQPPTGGTASMSLPASVTADLTCGDTLKDPLSQYVWDLELTDSNGKISSPLYGNVQVFREVTR